VANLRQFVGVHASAVAAYTLTVALFGFALTRSAGFGSTHNVSGLLTTTTLLALPALGQTLVVLTGGIDLSVPWIVSAGGVAMANYTASSELPGWLVAVTVVLGGGLIGLLSGIGVTVFAIPSIVMTLAVGGLVQGFVLSMQLSGGANARTAPAGLIRLVDTGFGPFPVITAMLLVGATLVGLALHRSRFGVRLYATGTNETVARLAGVRVQRVRAIVYVASGMASALAGILILGYARQAYLDMGNPYLFTSIAAVALGGVSLLGGSGTYWGTLGGAALITVLTTILPMFHVGIAQMQIAYGAIILAGVAMGRVGEHLGASPQSRTPTAEGASHG